MPDVTISFDDSVATPLRFTPQQVSPPAGLTATAVAVGGTFAAGTYFWEVTATTVFGETTVSNEATATLVLNGMAGLGWSAPYGVITGYKIYRGTVSGAENVLVATVGPAVTSFGDTGGGGAGAPPGTNTATIQDYVLMTGAGWFAGYSLSETSGTAAAFIEILDCSGVLGECRLASGGAETEAYYQNAIPLDGFIKLRLVSGVARGIVYARIPPVC